MITVGDIVTNGGSIKGEVVSLFRKYRQDFAKVRVFGCAYASEVPVANLTKVES